MNDRLHASADALRRGEPVVLTVVDGGVGGEVGGLVAAAARISADTVARLVRWGTGYLRVAVLNAAADRLDLPLLASTERGGAAAHYTVSVDARDGVSTGISAADRAHTIRLLADARSSAESFSRPGHVVPVRVNATAPDPFGWPEAVLDLVRFAGLPPAGVFCELVSPARPDAVADTAELRAFATAHRLVTVDRARVRPLRAAPDSRLAADLVDAESAQ